MPKAPIPYAAQAYVHSGKLFNVLKCKVTTLILSLLEHLEQQLQMPPSQAKAQARTLLGDMRKHSMDQAWGDYNIE
jgi:hypothetical protein